MKTTESQAEATEEEHCYGIEAELGSQSQRGVYGAGAQGQGLGLSDSSFKNSSLE